jgi:hypothetical protein
MKENRAWYQPSKIFLAARGKKNRYQLGDCHA